MTHDINSYFLLIHPPLCIVSYGLMAVALSMNFKYKPETDKKWFLKIKILLCTAWVLLLLGIVTGAVWAEIAWGQYWSWDPKETASLVLFIFLSIYSFIVFIRPEWKWVQVGAGVVTLLSIGFTISLNWIMTGLHSYV